MIKSKKNLKKKELSMTNSLLKESLTQLGYTNYSAIADIIDNCLEPNLNTKNVKIFLGKEGKNGISDIVIADDGAGMTLETLEEFFEYRPKGEKNGTNYLGKYGLGGKTASTSIGYTLEVFTKYVGTEEVNYGVLDLSDVDLTAKPVIYSGVADEEQKNYFNSFGFANGTVVRISNLYNLSNKDWYSFSGTIKNKISKIFYYYITDSKINFYVNNEYVEGIHPFGLGILPDVKRLSELGAHFEYNGNTIKYNAFFVPRHMDNKEFTRTAKNAGMYIFRQERLVGSGVTFGLYGKNTKDTWYSGLYIEVFIDGNSDNIFNTSVTKMINESDYNVINQGFKDVLFNELKPYLVESKRLEKELYSNKEKVKEEINKSLDNVTKKINNNKLLKVDVKKDKKEKNPNPKKQLNPNPHKNAKVNVGWFGGYEFASLGETGMIYEIRIDEGKVYCIINTDHSFYNDFLSQCEPFSLETIVLYFACQYRGMKLTGYYNDETIASVIDELMLQTSETFRILNK